MTYERMAQKRKNENTMYGGGYFLYPLTTHSIKQRFVMVVDKKEIDMQKKESMKV